MPLSAEDQAFRKQIFTNLKLEESLKPGDPRYEHVYDRPGCEDPAGRIRDQIELSGGESTIFLSGFRGSGKTTELLRLKHELEPDYLVIYADAIDYLNPSQPNRTSCREGIVALRGLVQRRFPPDGIERLLGPAWSETLDRLITLSGGHFRDLLRLFREVVLGARSLPAEPEVVERAIIEVRSSFLPIPVEDAQWLNQIASERATPLRGDSAEEASRLTKFLDTHLVLYLRNGEEWYDVHPLIRDEITRIVAANPS